ncbi:telomeric repeat-binding factor 2-interacting protein 1-like isoform X2 [Argopecten irradians]|uniref:telomeric repeat-binding factor 2-interacting protein 1-like isoform X2 n=1 Tax=Argopecten irradians TaxID=31199 RepID=UPI003723DE5E
MAAEKKLKTYNRFLFTNDNGEPLIFYMRPCAKKIEIRPLVEDGGGGMTSKVSRKCIKLAVESDQISSEGYVSIKYILDCVEKDTLLELDDYRLKPKKASADQSFVDVVDDLSPATKIERSEALALGRQKYSLMDDLAILKFFDKKRDLISKCSGLKIWHDMSLQIVTDHSAESMKDRFRKRILPNIDSYDVSSELKFLLTKNKKYLKESDHRKEGNQKTGEETTTENIQNQKSCSRKNPLGQLTTAFNKRDSFDQFLLEKCGSSKESGNKSEKDNSPDKKGNNSEMCNSPRRVRVVLEDLYPKSDKGHSSPVKQTINGSPSEKEARAANHVQLKQKPQPQCDKSDSSENSENLLGERLKNPQAPNTDNCPRKSDEIDENKEYEQRKRKIADVNHKQGPSKSLKKRPKTSHANVIEAENDPGLAKKSPRKNLPLTRRNVAKSSQQNRSFNRAERLEYVMDKFLENQDDEVAPQENIVNNSEDVESDEKEEEKDEVEEWEVEEASELVEDLMQEYNLTTDQVLHALFINNGSALDTMSWIETGLNMSNLPPWDHRDDDRLMSGDPQSFEILRNKYGLKQVNNRLLFLEGL